MNSGVQKLCKTINFPLFPVFLYSWNTILFEQFDDNRVLELIPSNSGFILSLLLSHFVIHYVLYRSNIICFAIGHSCKWTGIDTHRCTLWKVHQQHKSPKFNFILLEHLDHKTSNLDKTSCNKSQNFCHTYV